MPRHLSPPEERKLIWERIKKEAQRKHNHPDEHGIASKIAVDAGVTVQSVSGWKRGRAKPTAGAIGLLAAKYEVSANYLAGNTDDVTQTAPADQAAARAEMATLVRKVLTRLNPNADPFLVVDMCELALTLHQDGESENAILGALYKKLDEADSASAPQSSEEKNDSRS